MGRVRETEHGQKERIFTEGNQENEVVSNRDGHRFFNTNYAHCASSDAVYEGSNRDKRD